ncbi:hypothetical protein P280DRAFT_144624 [Massarina eburnea CBS 473.64]|uniref:Uncharacterized protein n=1 Tax=Massarina eburnea CBS 473.64 TaxID=1395130 RepID=A0A6A6RP39_9PLEO|nr:hypothetical protein P280DRAFT_144624 [Massarina eburnea CBS 473.64]
MVQAKFHDFTSKWRHQKKQQHISMYHIFSPLLQHPPLFQVTPLRTSSQSGHFPHPPLLAIPPPIDIISLHYSSPYRPINLPQDSPPHISTIAYTTPLLQQTTAYPSCRVTSRRAPRLASSPHIDRQPGRPRGHTSALPPLRFSRFSLQSLSRASRP